MKPEELKELAKAVHAELGFEKPDGVLAKAIGTALGISETDGPLAKAIGAVLTPKLDEMQKATATKLDELSTRVKHLEDQPANPQGALLALGKAADGGLSGALVGGIAEEALQKLAQSGPAGAIEAAKLIQKMPGNAYHVGGAGVRPIAG